MGLADTVRAMRRSLQGLAPVQHCPTCGPSRGPTRLVAPTDALEGCPECGGPLDRYGRAVGVPTPRGTYVLTVTTDDVAPPHDA